MSPRLCQISSSWCLLWLLALTTTTTTTILTEAFATPRVTSIAIIATNRLSHCNIRDSTTTTTGTTTTALYMGKSRKARRMDKQQVTKGRSKQFMEAMEEAQGKTKEKPKTGSATAVADNDAAADQEARDARNAQAQARMDARPDVSTMIVDETTGIEVLAQGKNVMDVVTRKAVRLSNLGPEYRLAQMFPGVPPDVRQAHRLDWKSAEVPAMVEALRQACEVPLSSHSDGSAGQGSRGIPPTPSVASKAIDFVLANRDLLGYRMKRTLGRLTLRAAADGDTAQARANQQLWKHFLILENHISAPFRQMIMDAEGRVGPNFGNLDLSSYCQGPLYERCANYLVLKGMVAHWEKKVVDADYVERTPSTKDNYISVISRGDPRRYLPDPPILFSLKECTQVCYMAQQMTKAFVETPELFDDLPPEIRFLETALTIQGGTALRKYMVDEFCPAEEITPEGLREGLRRLVAQLDNMQVDPYGDIVNILERLIKATEVGTDDARDPYAVYLANRDRSGPGRFQTYTFNHEQLSLVRFLDNQYEGKNDGGPAPPPAPGGDDLFGNLFNFGGGSAAEEDPKRAPRREPGPESELYKVPQIRSVGRPHELGWLDELNALAKEDNAPMGKIQPGRIIPDGEAA